MGTIKIIQIGMGPLGIKIAKMIAERNGIETVSAVDINPSLTNTDLGELCGAEKNNVLISNDLATEVERTKPDIAVLTTVSDMKRITSQLPDIIKLGLPVVSTCEELSYPWEEAPNLASELDKLAKVNNVAILGTGVNPGFLMDTLPITLTAVCQDVTKISR